MLWIWQVPYFLIRSKSQWTKCWKYWFYSCFSFINALLLSVILKLKKTQIGYSHGLFYNWTCKLSKRAPLAFAVEAIKIHSSVNLWGFSQLFGVFRSKSWVRPPIEEFAKTFIRLVSLLMASMVKSGVDLLLPLQVQ